MRVSEGSSLIAFVAAVVVMPFALPGRAPGQTDSVESSGGRGVSVGCHSVQGYCRDRR